MWDIQNQLSLSRLQVGCVCLRSLTPSRGISHTPLVNAFVQNLLTKRRQLLESVSHIDQLLANEGITQDDAAKLCPVNPVVQLPAHARNTNSKADRIRDILAKASKPLSPSEILQRLITEGYVFASRYPRSTLNPLLYGARRLNFIYHTPQGFILRGREREFGFSVEASPATKASEEVQGSDSTTAPTPAT